MTRKKKKLRLKIDFVTCLVIALAVVIVGYGLIYMKGSKPKQKVDTKKLVMKELADDKKEQEEKKSNSIDVESKIVKDLYGRVTSVDGEYKYWMYTDYDQITDTTSNMTASTAKEIIKMNFVGNSIDSSKAETVTCDNKVPDIIANTRSVCSNNKRNHANQEEVGYKKDYVGSIYTSIFGGTFTPDSTIPLYIAPNSGEVYYYVDALSMYIKYYGEPNSVAANGSYTGELSKVTEENKQLELLENVTNGDNKIKFKYTFEKENNGNYIFISREKED